MSTDDRLPTLLAAAERASMAIAFHLEPYPGRTAETIREDLLYLMRRPELAASPAVLRLGPQRLPLYFVYDSYHISPADWAVLLTPGGKGSLRGGDGDGEGGVRHGKAGDCPAGGAPCCIMRLPLR